MKATIIFLSILLISCSQISDKQIVNNISGQDSLILLNMIKERENGMINKEINSVMSQFDSNAIFINGGGFYFKNFAEIQDFHKSMFDNESLTYTYKIGNPFIYPINNGVAVVYYP